MKVSPSTHPDSLLTASKIDTMIDKAIEFKRQYFSITDNGYLTGTLKAYEYCLKHNIKPILGVEAYFLDKNCPFSNKINPKYYKICIHATNHPNWRLLVKKCSDFSEGKTITLNDRHFPLFTWEDLQLMSDNGLVLTSSATDDIVSKNVILNRTDLAENLFNRLCKLNYYPTIIAVDNESYNQAIVKIQLNGNKTIELPIDARIETDIARKAKAKDILKGRHNRLISFILNNIKYKVKWENQQIINSTEINKTVNLGRNIQLDANKFLVEMCNKYNKLDELLISDYAYYAEEEDKPIQDMKIGLDGKRQTALYPMRENEYLTNYCEKIGVSGLKIKENQNNWCLNFDGFKLVYKQKLPHYDNPKQMILDRIGKVGRMDYSSKARVDKLNYEMDLLESDAVKKNLGLDELYSYFLPIVEVFDNYQENNMLTSVGRGSCPGFYLAYLLGITHVDPFKHNLSSERFITTARIEANKMPDFDADLPQRFQLVGQDGSSGFLFNRFGKDVAQISTRTLLRLKSAILDANRHVNGEIQMEAQKLAKSLPAAPQGVDDSSFIHGYEDEDENHIDGLLDTNKELKAWKENRPEEWNIIERSLSLTRQFSRHACSFSISDSAITDEIPTFKVGDVDGVCQWEHKQVEKAGIIKYDFLIVTAVQVIEDALKLINKKDSNKDIVGYFNHNKERLFIWDLPQDDNVFKMLGEGRTETIFQFNTDTATPFVKRIKPKSIEELAAITAVCRPGPILYKMSNGKSMAEEYIDRSQGKSKSHLDILNSMFPETFGTIIYQEQTSRLCIELSNINPITAENIREAIGKKNMKQLLEYKPMFINGASSKIGIEAATEIWDMMETCGSYIFNKSHAISYTYVSYASAFLKKHYPLEWWSSCVSNASSKEYNEELFKYVKDIILPPDINLSNEDIVIDYTQGKLRQRLSLIKGLGESVTEKIISGRPYTNIQDFIDKKVCNEPTARKLCHVGVLDSLFEPNDLKSLSKKMLALEIAINEREFKKKLNVHELKVAELTDEKKLKAAIKAMEKFKETGRKLAQIDEQYIGISPLDDFKLKKSIFPTMTMDLYNIVKDSGVIEVAPGSPVPRYIIDSKREVPLVTGEMLQRIEELLSDSEFQIACPAYVISCEEFNYSKNTKKALKMNLDSCNYMSEKVLWPDYNSGELIYDKNIAKGSIVMVVYKKRADKDGINVVSVKLLKE